MSSALSEKLSEAFAKLSAGLYLEGTTDRAADRSLATEHPDLIAHVQAGMPFTECANEALAELKNLCPLLAPHEWCRLAGCKLSFQNGRKDKEEITIAVALIIRLLDSGNEAFRTFAAAVLHQLIMY